MDPVAASAVARTPQVIELRIEETIEYVLKWIIQIKTPLRVASSRVTPKIQLNQATKVRPIAKVYPAVRERKRSTSVENFDKQLTIIDDDKSSLVDELQKADELKESSSISLISEASEGEEKTHNPEFESSAFNDTGTTSCEKLVTEAASLLNHDDSSYSKASTLEKLQTNLVRDNAKAVHYHNKQFDKFTDPCACHRDWVRKNKNFSRESATYIYCYCTVRMECVNGEGCQTESKELHHKETSITDCLEEFLAGLHLSHLVDYFKVLGCMCVRDLRLLETPELDAIQLISRRRLLQQLDSITLHHEAPPADCSLEAWLTWYGLTHISGFLTAIGVHSVGDLGYLREEDLQLLKPVTRRRILTCKLKYREKGRMMQNGLIRNDYLM